MMNPPKFDQVEDMAELLYMHEPAVVHNLTQRYIQNDIYASIYFIKENVFTYLLTPFPIDIFWPFLGSCQSLSSLANLFNRNYSTL